MMKRWRYLFLFLLLVLSYAAEAQLIVAPVVSPVQQRVSLVPWMPVKVNRKWGYADTSGKVMIAPRFDAAEEFIGRYAVVQIGNKAYVIDTSGTIQTPQGHDQILQLEDSIFAVYKNSDEGGEGGWGAEKTGGKEILPTRYDRITRTSYFIFACRLDTALGFFHRNGTLIAPVRYDTGWVYNGHYLALSNNRLLGVNAFTGVVVLPDSCTRIKIITNNIIAGEKNKSWGAADDYGKTIVPFVYDSIAALGSRFIYAGKKDSVHLYCASRSGKKIEGNYTYALPYGAFWLKAYTKEKKCAIVDTSGRIVVPPLYDDVLFAGDGNWLVVNNKLWGICDTAGKVIVAPAYTLIQPFRNGMSIVFSGTLQGLINRSGEVLVAPCQCNIVIKGNIAKVMKPGAKAEFVKTDGNGHVTSRDEYEEVRVIKIGGDNSYRQPKDNGGYENSKLLLAPKGDSLAWFVDVSTRKFGLMDTYRGDTLCKAVYSFAKKLTDGLTLVGIADTIESVVLGGQVMESGMLYGVYDDTAGRFLIQPRYTTLSMYNWSTDRQHLLFRCVRRDGVQGLISADGTERIFQASCIGYCINGIAPFCVGGKWEFSSAGGAAHNWSGFAKEFNIVNNGPFRSATESNRASNRAITHTGGKWGFIDANGRVLVPPTYDAFEMSQEGTCIVRLDKKWGMIDTTGKILVPFLFDAVHYVRAGNGWMVQTQMNTTQMGCVDTLGNIVVPLQYKKIIALGGGFIGVSTSGKWGISRCNGQVITDEIYTEVAPFSEGYAGVRTGRKWGIIDSTGREIVAPLYDQVAVFSNGMCAVRQSLFWGYVNTSGQLAVPCNYTMVGPFFRNLAPVKTRTGWGLIDSNGKFVVKDQYSFIERVGQSPVFTFRKDGSNGLLSSDGKVILPARYDKFKDIGAGRLAYLDNIHWGIMDTLGVVIANSIFDRTGEFSNGLCPVAVGSQWGYIRLNGQYAIKPQYRAAGQFGDGLAYVVTFRSGSGFIDTLGTMRFSTTGNYGTTVFSENKTLVKDKTYWAFYTRFGHRLSRDHYLQAHSFYHGAAPVRADRWGLINFTGRYLIPPSFSQMSPFRDGVSIVQTSASYGLYNLKGKEILAPEYDVIRSSGTLIRLQRNNQVGYLSLDGRVVWSMQE